MAVINLTPGTKISKSFQLDYCITSLDQLHHYMDDKKSIYVTRWSKVHPTAWIKNMNFSQISIWLECGYFYAIKKV